jgi:hypothetical protein
MCSSISRSYQKMRINHHGLKKFEDTKWVIRSRKLKDRQHNVGKKRKKTQDKQRSKQIKLNLLFIILIGCITTSDICNINRFWLLSLGSLILDHVIVAKSWISKTLNVPCGCYSRNVSCALISVSTF